MRNSTLLAFDLGASSGRALAGRLRDGRLTVTEVHRFPNDPVKYNGEMHWNMPGLWTEMQTALAALGAHGVDRLDSLGVDTWGVDYALVGENGVLLENPYHYRDRRTDGVMEKVLQKVSHEFIYDITGIQFMPINTLYQLYAASRRTPELLSVAQHLLTIPDLLNFWLAGTLVCERTNASTTQFLDRRNGEWSTELLRDLGIRHHMLSPLVKPGTELGGLIPDLARLPGLDTAAVVAPACHDTGSAVAAVRASGSTAFLSSGTWSLLGSEVKTAVAGPEALRLNFTNEGGVCDTFRLLKNITGLWLLEGCRRVWEKQGNHYPWNELQQMMNSAQPFQSLVDPDHASFVRPDDMTAAIAAFCKETQQPVPATAGGYVRAVLESLALKYRMVLEQLETLTKTKVDTIRVIGGGAQNAALNQFTADCTGRKVLAGPAEATALGNIAMQMLATGVAAKLDDARDLIERSFPPQSFQPSATEKWDAAYTRFQSYCARIPSYAQEQ